MWLNLRWSINYQIRIKTKEDAEITPIAQNLQYNVIYIAFPFYKMILSHYKFESQLQVYD